MDERQYKKQHQLHLKQQAETARQQRIAEQQKLAHLQQEAVKLKQEALNLAHAREQQRIKEERALTELAVLKKNQEKKLKSMQQEQIALQKQHEIQRLLEIKKNNDQKLAKQHIEKSLLAKKTAESAAAQRAENAKNIALAAAKQTRMMGEVNKYKAMILQAIGRQWILPEHADSRLASKFHIRLAPNGTVLEVSLIHSSGDSLLDRSAQLAIYKASPLPVPVDIATFNIFRDISLTVRPEHGGQR